MENKRQILSRIKIPANGIARAVWLNDYFGAVTTPMVNKIKLYTGSAFQNVEVKMFNGTSFQNVEAKIFDGTNWINLN